MRNRPPTLVVLQPAADTQVVDWRETVGRIVQQIEALQLKAHAGGAHVMAFQLGLAAEEPRAELRRVGAEVIHLTRANDALHLREAPPSGGS